MTSGSVGIQGSRDQQGYLLAQKASIIHQNCRCCLCKLWASRPDFVRPFFLTLS